jgi:hypothetical protein
MELPGMISWTKNSVNHIARGNGGQAGEGKFKAIFFTVILVATVYTTFKLAPPYFAEYQFKDKIDEQARFGVVGHTPEPQIRDNVFKVAQDLDIPIKAEEIKISASANLVTISVDYSVPVDLAFYHVDLHFTPSSANKSLY